MWISPHAGRLRLRWPVTLDSASSRGFTPPKISGTRAEGTLTVEYPDLSTEVESLKAMVKQVSAERDALKEQQDQNLQEQRRRRIEDWRSDIRNFDFDVNGFAGTDTYSQLRPHLSSEVVEMFEMPRGVHIGNEARGDLAYEYTLLDEVARIEREWGLI